MTSSKPIDHDLLNLNMMLGMSKEKMIKTLQEKIEFLETLNTGTCCTITLQQLHQVKVAGKSDWTNLVNVVSRITARKKMIELSDNVGVTGEEA